MNPVALIDHLDSLGIRLWVEQDALRFKAPQGALTDRLREQIRAARGEIIDVLRSSAAPVVCRDPQGAAEPFPLTDVQASYLVGRTDAFAFGGVGCHGYAEFDVDLGRWGDAAEEVLGRAWQRVVECHPMLRMVVSPDGWQRVVPDLEVPLQVLDLGADPGARERVRAELRAKVYPVGRGPMIEVVVTRAGEAGILHLSVDLLLTDYLGLSVIMGDLARALTAPDSPLRHPSLTFRDYVLTTRTRADSPAGRAAAQRDRAFWADRAATLLGLLELSPALGDPTAGAGAASAVRFTRRSHVVSHQRLRHIERAAGAAGSTVSALLVGLLGRTAHRHGAAESGVVAMTVLDREPVVADVDRIVGDFTDTVFVEVDGRAGVPLAELARTVQASLFESLDHRALSGVEVGRLLARARDVDGFAAPIVVTSTLGAAAALPEGILRPRTGAGRSQTPQVLLDVQFSPVPEGVAIDWDSRDGGFDPDVLSGAFADFTAALDAFETATLDRDPLPRRRLPGIRASGRTPQTLPGPVVDRWREDPDAIAVVTETEVWTRGQVVAAAAQVARHLEGAAPGVLIALPPGPVQIAAELGVLLTDRFYVPLDVAWPAGRRAGIAAAVRAEAGEPVVLDERHPAIVGLRRSAGAEVELPAVPVEPRHRAYTIFTSGSTGRPKGVVVTHEQARTTLADLDERLGLSAADAVLAVSRPSFDLAVFNTFGVLGAGGRVVFAGGGGEPDPRRWAEALRRHEVTVWNSVPAQLELLVDHLDAAGLEDGWGSLRWAMVSGDWVPVGQPARLWAYAPQARFLALGGATEASIWSGCHEVTAPLDPASRSVPYGRALTDQGLWVLNAADEPATVGQIGDIVIGGGGVAEGYLGEPEQTAAAFFTHPDNGVRCYRTGDRGRLLPDGAIEFLGRTDSQVKIRGHRIELGEIEAALAACESVAHAVAAVSATAAGRQLVAGVVPERDARHATARRERDDQVVRAMTAADTALIADLDAGAWRRLAALVDECCCERMAALVGQGAGRPVCELPAVLGAEPRAALVGRWVRLLAERGWIAVADGVLSQCRTPDQASVEQRWREVGVLADEVGHGRLQLDYVARCLAELPGLLRGEVDPLSLLFPGGDTAVARAAYGENRVARWINGVVAAGVARQAAQLRDLGRPIRILEIGGGVGGTTDPVMRALHAELGGELAGLDYLFTDISPYFFGEISERWPGLRTHVVDLNADPVRQGVVPGSFDIVLLANVLHNARDIPAALTRLAELLAPGGAVVLLEPTSVSASLMTSMEFQAGLEGFADLRQDTGRPFLDLRHWREVISASPLRLTAAYPREDDPQHPMQAGHQHAFWLSGRDADADIDPAQLLRRVGEVLPAAMVPRTLAVLTELPLTSNGKIDRGRVAALAEAPRHSAAVAEPDPLTAEQERIALIWREVLGLAPGAPVGPGSDFFDLGGDSLLLARCIGRLRSEVPGAGERPWDEVMRRMVADPTLTGCAAALAPAQPEPPATAPGDPLVELLAAEGMTGEVLALLHDGSGDLGPYRDLIAELGRTRPRPRVVGLRRRPDDGYLDIPPEALFDQLADTYAEALRSVGAARVHLVGYCLGGLLAVGLATRLAEAGIEIGGTTVVSSYRLPFALEDEVLLDYSLARVLRLDPALAGIEVAEAELGEALAEARRRSPAVIADGAVRRAAGPSLAAALDRVPRTVPERLGLLAQRAGAGAWSLDTLTGLRAVFVHSLQAVSAWAGPPYLGELLFLRQRGSVHFLPTLREDMTAFWADLCPTGLEIRDIDGTHFDCLQGARAAGVVGLLAERWAR